MSDLSLYTYTCKGRVLSTEDRPRKHLCVAGDGGVVRKQ